MRTVAAAGATALYDGVLSEDVVGTVAADGGYLSLDDLARHRTTEMPLISAPFAGHVVWELDRPTQGLAVIDAVSRIDPTLPIDWTAVLEAVREGMRRAGFDPSAIAARPSPARGDTTYVAVVDGAGRGASLITSVFGDFGSHLGVAAIGGPIGNRATMLRALRQAPTPGAKPPHTTIPAAVTDDGGGLRYVLGVAGGFMQPQAQVQLLVRMLGEDMAPQEAIDAPASRCCSVARSLSSPVIRCSPPCPTQESDQPVRRGSVAPRSSAGTTAGCRRVPMPAAVASLR